jgi:hypothetical protein
MHSRFTPTCFSKSLNHQGVVVTSEATQAKSVLRMYMDYDPSGVASCRVMQPGVYSMFGPTIKRTEVISMGSVIMGAKEDESSTGRFWAAGFHYITARTRLAGVLKLTNRLFL